MSKLKTTAQNSKLPENLAKIILILILSMAFVVRLYKINNPVADWHSWRQADTSSVTRNFEKFGFDLLHPHFDDLSNIASGKDNPAGYRFVEFPLYNSVPFILSKLFVQFNFTLEKWERIVSIFSSLVSIYLVFLICNRFLNTKIALFSSFFLSVLPFSVYYSRVILPEPMMMAASLAMIYFFTKTVENNYYKFYKNYNFYISALFGIIALLLKPFVVFFFLPVIYLWFTRKTRKEFSLKSFFCLFFYLLICLFPLGLWRWWMSHYPEGIPAWTWLLNSDGIRFKGAFFYWLFAERLSKLVLGYWGLFLLLLGILVRPEKKEGWFFRWWGIAMLLYVTIFATGNVRHDYYQIITLPIIAIYLGKGVDFLLNQAGRLFNRFTGYGLLFTIIIFMLAFSWYHLRTYYWVNRPEIVEAGEVADELLPKDAKVIAPYGGDTAFLYQINRQGWPIGFEIEDKIKKGATYYVSVEPNDLEVQELERKYEVLRKTEGYVIIKLLSAKTE